MNAKLLLLLIGSLLLPTVCNASSKTVEELSWIKEVGARQLPPNTTSCFVNQYGAVADGRTLATGAIQQAIDECYAQGGGVVTFEKGIYLSGAIYIKEGVNLHIPEEVILLGSTDINDYPEIETRVAGIEMKWPSALINVLDTKDAMISGKGIVHAQGKVFWDLYWTMRREYEARGLRWIVDYDCKRPRTLLVSNSSDITVRDLTFKQAGFWTIQLLYSSHCSLDGVVIKNNEGGHGPSTDGIDIDSSSYILVENCDIDCNDDNFCLKAGRDADGLRVNRPTEYVVIRNCISRAGGGLITCGSETSGGIRYVLAQGLKAKGTQCGIRLKSALTRGGTTAHIYLQDIEMEDVGIAIEATVNWNPSYSYSTLPDEYEGQELPPHWVKMLQQVTPREGMPYFHDIYYSNITVRNAKQIFHIAGHEESRMRNFRINQLSADGESAGIISYAEDWEACDIQINTTSGQPIQIENSKNVHLK